MNNILNLNKDLPELTQFYSDNTAFKPAEADEEGKRAFRTIAASDKPTADFRRILAEGLPVVATDLEKRQPMMVNHDTWGWNGDALPIGKTTSGKYIKKLQIVESDFYLDDKDYTERILSGIDLGTIDSVSIGASGKFKCSYDGSRMSFFGCYKNGHYRGQEIMLDKDGNETESPSDMVRSVFIYAEFEVRLVDELSIVWKGAVPDANITKKYHHDPAQNQAIIEAVRSVYDQKGMHEYELQRLCAAYGGLDTILNQSTAPVTVPVTTTIGGNEKNMAAPNIAPEIQARIDELEASKARLETELATAQTTIESQQQNSEDTQAMTNRIVELEASETALKAENASHEAKSDLYDALVAKLRIDLRVAKQNSGVSEAELATFSEKVDTMGDALNMLVLLDEIKEGKGKTGNFSRVITVQQQKSENEEIDKIDRARIMAAY